MANTFVSSSSPLSVIYIIITPRCTNEAKNLPLLFREERESETQTKCFYKIRDAKGPLANPSQGEMKSDQREDKGMETERETVNFGARLEVQKSLVSYRCYPFGDLSVKS